MSPWNISQGTLYGEPFIDFMLGLKQNSYIWQKHLTFEKFSGLGRNLSKAFQEEDSCDSCKVGV